MILNQSVLEDGNYSVHSIFYDSSIIISISNTFGHITILPNVHEITSLIHPFVYRWLSTCELPGCLATVSCSAADQLFKSFSLYQAVNTARAAAVWLHRRENETKHIRQANCEHTGHAAPFKLETNWCRWWLMRINTWSEVSLEDREFAW